MRIPRLLITQTLFPTDTSLVDGDGDTDNESFNIVGNELHTAVAFDFETQTTYTIRVRSADQDGEFFEQLFTIFVSEFPV